MEIQGTLGSDIAMVLDECAPYPCDYEYAARSAEMTARWARRCKTKAVSGNPKRERQLVFGIVQGATFDDLRRSSAQAVVDLDFDGYAIGGVSVGEPEEEMMRAVEASEPFLPKAKPRYAMGLGTPPQLLEMIARGMDMFDCVLPTRLARNGTAFTATGTLANGAVVTGGVDSNPGNSTGSSPITVGPLPVPVLPLWFAIGLMSALLAIALSALRARRFRVG